MNDLTDATVLIGERILCNAVKDTHFTFHAPLLSFTTLELKQKRFFLLYIILLADFVTVNGLAIIIGLSVRYAAGAVLERCIQLQNCLSKLIRKGSRY
jgi:hypothetical protein